jgi:hypothetical protein
MKLLFLHGPPASGKRTVGEAVCHLTAGRLFDNHAAVDFARTVLDFDAAGFWDLVHSARIIALQAAGKHGVPLVERHGGVLLPVFLSCSRRTLEERVGAPDRVQRRKVTTKEGLDQCLARWNLVPVPRNGYTVDTDAMTPAAAAAAIVAHFGLQKQGSGGG